MLRGIKIVELAPLFPGPYAGRILLDMGASVIKVNPPLKLSSDLLHVAAMRHRAAQSKEDGGGAALSADAGYAAMYTHLNAGKVEVEVDLQKADAVQALLDEHIGNADVVIQGYRPGSLDKVGLGPQALRMKYPKLVVCCVTGYGLTGPMSTKAGHDLNYLARNGVLGMALPRATPRGDVPNESPNTAVPSLSPLPVQLADVGGGTFPAVINILSMLVHIARGGGSLDGLPGPGGVMDISMAECSQAFLILSQVVADATGGVLPVDRGAFSLCGGAPCYNVYATKDGLHMSVGALEPPYWKRVVGVLGLPDEYKGPARQMGLGLDETELDKTFRTIAAAFSKKSQAEWVEAFAGVDAMVEPVVAPEDAMQSEHIRQRQREILSSWNKEQRKLSEEHPLVPPSPVALRRWSNL